MFYVNISGLVDYREKHLPTKNNNTYTRTFGINLNVFVKLALLEKEKENVIFASKGVSQFSQLICLIQSLSFNCNSYCTDLHYNIKTASDTTTVVVKHWRGRLKKSEVCKLKF